MKKIVIDGRRLRMSTGRYTRQLLTYLEKIDQENEYLVLINEDDKGAWKPSNKNFRIKVVPYQHYSLGEQIGMAWFLYRQKADLVHFTMPQQPILYFKKHITTIHDLTVIRYKNAKKSLFIYNFKQFVFKVLIQLESRLSKQILTVTEYSKRDIADYTRVSPNKITATHLASDPINDRLYFLIAQSLVIHKFAELRIRKTVPWRHSSINNVQ